jgi:hypothetical protein
MVTISPVAVIMITATRLPIVATWLSTTFPVAVIMITATRLPIAATRLSTFPVAWSVVVMGPTLLPSSTPAFALVTVLARLC